MARRDTKPLAYHLLKSVLLVIYLLGIVTFVWAEHTYVGPEAEDNKAGRYPTAASLDGAEALVWYTYVIDETGQVTDIQVTQLLGESVFESRVIEWLEGKSFTPALLNGEPVKVWEQQRHIFLIDGRARGAKNSFVVHWKRFMRELSDSDYKSAERYIQKMRKVRNRSLYEELYLQHAAATLAITQGDYATAYPHLQKAHGLMIYGFSDGGGLIGPADLYYNLLIEKYQIEAEQLRLGDAMETRNALQELYPEAQNTLVVEEHLTSLLQKVAGKEFQIEAILAPSIYSASSGGWGTWLISRVFTLSEITGELEQVILDCDRGQLFLDATDGKAHQAPEGWGACRLVLLGGSGTTVKLLQRR